METLVDTDSPLATFLEGHGTHDDDSSTADSAVDLPLKDHTTDRPEHISLRARIRRCLTSKRSIREQIQSAHSHAYRQDQFLERFRYIIVGSHLVDEFEESGAARGSSAAPLYRDYNDASFGVAGVLLTALCAFLAVFVIKYLKDLDSMVIRCLVGFACIALVIPLYLSSRSILRLQQVRGQAIAAATTLVTKLQDFEHASAAALTLIQEVELVSRGYRVSSPLPPITRLDDSRTTRRCATLRCQLGNILIEELVALSEAIESFRAHVGEDDLARYFDIYDMPRQACHDALTHPARVETVSIDQESLAALRLLAYKRSLLRRHLLCSLLAIETANGPIEVERWHQINGLLGHVAVSTSSHTHSLKSTLSDLAQFVAPPSPKSSASPAPERIRAQLRQIATLSQGIRSIHAKMALMREESSRAIEDTEDLADLGPVLICQYDSIGAELQSLLQDWKAGKATLSSNIERHSRSTSLAFGSPSFLSPTTSLGGLTAVSDAESFSIDTNLAGGPADALRALNGGATDSAQSDTSSTVEEQIFEGIAQPRKRASLFPPGMSRAERIAKQNEERARQELAREKRVSGTSMIRELQSVINLRRTSMPVSTKDLPARNAVSPGLDSASEAVERVMSPSEDALGILPTAILKERRTSSLMAKPFGLDIRT